MEAIVSGFGGESTDKILVSTSFKPVWHLRPLPLSQVRPITLTQQPTRGPAPSLTSYCLTVISHNLHLLPPDGFANLPPNLVQRIFTRLRADRGYEDFNGKSTVNRPDEATIWAYSALADPESTEKDHTIGLPVATTVKSLTLNPLSPFPDHPLVVIPSLYAQLQPVSPLTLITTLTLDGVDGALTDQSVLALKWCTKLTCLWMKGCCDITDAGIRLLASALELPGDSSFADIQGRGMWKLRGWWLSGCKKISDRSMRSFARWPGLVVLDVRDTSCTTVAMDIFNRSSKALFAGINPDFQSCTVGLKPLFSYRDPPSQVVENLALTLLGFPSSSTHTPNPDSKRYLALHIVPSFLPIPVEYLPEAPGAPKKQQSTYSTTTTYRGGGVGQVYGTGVSRMSNPEGDFRRAVKTALRIQGEEDHDDALRAAGKRVPKRLTPWEEEKLYKKEQAARRKRIEKARLTGDWSAVDRPTKFQKGKKKTKKEIEADERSRAFVSTGPGTRVDVEVDVIKGEEKLMMVRMVDEGWERLSWAVGSASVLARIEQAAREDEGSARALTESLASSQNAAVRTVSTNRKGTNSLVGTLMGSINSNSPASAKSAVQGVKKSFDAFRPKPKTAFGPSSSPPNLNLSSSSSMTSYSDIHTPSISRNPFRSQSTTHHMTGSRPLVSEIKSDFGRDWEVKSTRSSGLNYGIDEKIWPSGVSSDGVSFESRTFGSQPISTLSNLHDDGLSFETSSSKKRAWSGNGPTTDVRRRGMKMFSSSQR